MIGDNEQQIRLKPRPTSAALAATFLVAPTVCDLIGMAVSKNKAMGVIAGFAVGAAAEVIVLKMAAEGAAIALGKAWGGR